MSPVQPVKIIQRAQVVAQPVYSVVVAAEAQEATARHRTLEQVAG
jgi:hypothetical protein